jgi:hypothetical protein
MKNDIKTYVSSFAGWENIANRVLGCVHDVSEVGSCGEDPALLELHFIFRDIWISG